jgi:hypothetical protein
LYNDVFVIPRGFILDRIISAHPEIKIFLIYDSENPEKYEQISSNLDSRMRKKNLKIIRFEG